MEPIYVGQNKWDLSTGKYYTHGTDQLGRKQMGPVIWDRITHQQSTKADVTISLTPDKSS